MTDLGHMIGQLTCPGRCWTISVKILNLSMMPFLTDKSCWQLYLWDITLTQLVYGPQPATWACFGGVGITTDLHGHSLQPFAHAQIPYQYVVIL